MSIVLRSFILAVATAGLSGCLGTSAGSLTPPASDSVSALRGGLIGQSRLQLTGGAERSALEAEYQALQFGRVGVPTAWEADGLRGEVVPTQLYRVGSQDCRGYTHRVAGPAGTVQEVGSACRNGSLWTPV